MSRPLPPHGHHNRYAYGCRCKPCTKAASRADAERRLDRLAGRPRSVPVEDVLPHLTALAERLAPYRIAQESGVEYRTVRCILNGEQKTVLRRNAQKLLALPVTVEAAAGEVPALGAIRRLRALYALGHFNRVIAEQSGISRDTVSALVAGQWKTINVEHNRGIRRAYDRLSMTVGTSWKTRKLAQEKGWPPALAWDDDTIDDPQAEPQWDAPAPVEEEDDPTAVARWLMGESVVLGPAGRREAISHLMQHTSLTPEQIGRRLDLKPASVSRTWERIKKQAREEGRPVWRRHQDFITAA